MYEIGCGDMGAFPPSPETDDEILTRFEQLVQTRINVSELLTQNRVNNASNELSLDYLFFDTNISGDPTMELFSQGYDVLKQMGYDIVFALPALGPNMKHLGCSVKVMVHKNDFEKVHKCIEAISPFKRINPHVQPDMGDMEDVDCVLTGLHPAYKNVNVRLGSLVANEAYLRKHKNESDFDPIDIYLNMSDFLLLSRENPGVQPLGIEECAGMISSRIHKLWEEHPELKPS
jgi:hypothetical protein